MVAPSDLRLHKDIAGKLLHTVSPSILWLLLVLLYTPPHIDIGQTI
jgi:hypothetical protein